MTEEITRKRCPLWVRILLALSLALNLAIVGLVAGLLTRGPGPLRGGGPGLSYALPYIVALDRTDRRAVMGAVRNDPSLPDRRSRKAQFDDMLAALRAEPMDRAAVRAVLASQADGVARVQAVAQEAWLDTIEAMSPQERRNYADTVEAVLQKGPRGKRGKPPKPD
ncbi:periplasmic heavy metal sensor [uncultured Tateyamaria sp.]|uniref:periplasmic heavy metal sensor n=1 Tax=Tateyamaria sp. 1078 TaxID=3417464 RepID=UPI002616C5D0|nr:periplasmic heavy metal sensor [uncultured Tateyamaria sp.]